MTEVFGYQACLRCHVAVLHELAWKTGGLCATCFRNKVMPIVDTIVDANGERIRVTLTKRSDGERAARQRAKRRNADKDHDRRVDLAAQRAKAKLARVFPDVFEAILADERDKLGLPAWTLERILTAHQLTDETMARVEFYALVDRRHDAHLDV